MKYKLLPCLLAILLTGCDRTEVTLSFTPEMASFSNEFDFDPLRGPVKDFTQTLMDEQGKVTKRVSGTGNDSNLLIVFYVQIMPDDLVMQLHR
ncbi:YnfC family lipoprotein, partial [Escherichia coli]|nr:YnfC family lipoprotein [Escherichia coli]